MVLKEGPRATTLWWPSDTREDSWHHGEVTVGRMPQDFTILFEASRAFTKPGHLAIDDIDFTTCSLPGNLLCLCCCSDRPFFKADLLSFSVSFIEPQPVCPEHMFTCNNSVCVEVSRVCDYSDDCGDRSDESECGEISQICLAFLVFMLIQI